jgi:hypothetical protein
MTCHSTIGTSQNDSKLRSADLAAIRRLDRLLERDLYIEGIHRDMQRYGPPVEVLATSSNPDKKTLSKDRLRWAYAQTVVHALQSGDGASAGASPNGWPQVM